MTEFQGALIDLLGIAEKDQLGRFDGVMQEDNRPIVDCGICCGSSAQWVKKLYI
jgi:hypothetical protein